MLDAEHGLLTQDWSVIRETANHYSNGPVTSVTDPEFRCYELDLANTAGQTQTATVAAGSTIGFKANGAIYHPGVRISSTFPQAACERLLTVAVNDA